jgi:hypothetical protein
MKKVVAPRKLNRGAPLGGQWGQCRRREISWVKRKSAFFNKKTEETGVFLFAHEFMAGSFGPTGQVIPGTRVGAQNLKDLAGTELADLFFGPQQRHRATQALGVQGVICFNIGRGKFYVTHLILLLIIFITGNLKVRQQSRTQDTRN